MLSVQDRRRFGGAGFGLGGLRPLHAHKRDDAGGGDQYRGRDAAGDEQARPALAPLEFLDQCLHMGLRNVPGSVWLEREAGGVCGAIARFAVAVSVNAGTEVGEKVAKLPVRRHGAKPREQ